MCTRSGKQTKQKENLKNLALKEQGRPKGKEKEKEERERERVRET